MKHCDEKQLGLMTAGALSPAEAQACQAHLVICPECRVEHAEWAAVAGQFRAHALSLPPAEGVPELHLALEHHLKAGSPRVKKRPEVVWLFRIALPAAAVIVFLAVALHLERARHIPERTQEITENVSPTQKESPPPAPTLLTYRSATRRSLEEFDRVLDDQIRTTTAAQARKNESSISLDALL